MKTATTAEALKHRATLTPGEVYWIQSALDASARRNNGMRPAMADGTLAAGHSRSLTCCHSENEGEENAETTCGQPAIA